MEGFEFRNDKTINADLRKRGLRCLARIGERIYDGRF